MNRWLKKASLIGWILLLCSGVYQLQWAIELSSASRTRKQPLYLPNGKLLHVISLGYDNALADALWLYSVQYVMEEFWAGKKYVWLQHIFDLITELDPQFEFAYVQGAMFLGMMQRRPELSIELLEKGKRNNPDSWVYPAEQSFYAMIHLRDRNRAIEYVKEAAEKPGAPPQLYTRLARLYATVGKQELSLRHWMQLEQNASDPKFRKVAQENVAWLMLAMEKQHPKAARGRWLEIAAATDDPVYAAIAKGHAKRIDEKLAKRTAQDQQSPESQPESSPQEAPPGQGSDSAPVPKPETSTPVP